MAARYFNNFTRFLLRPRYHSFHGRPRYDFYNEPKYPSFYSRSRSTYKGQVNSITTLNVICLAAIVKDRNNQEKTWDDCASELRMRSKYAEEKRIEDEEKQRREYEKFYENRVRFVLADIDKVMSEMKTLLARSGDSIITDNPIVKAINNGDNFCYLYADRDIVQQVLEEIEGLQKTGKWSGFKFEPMLYSIKVSWN